MFLSLLELLCLFFGVYIDTLSGSNFTYSQTNNTCSTRAPSLMIPISSVAPTIALQNSSLFIVSQDTKEDLIFDLLLSIHVPDDSYRCQLELRFPYGYHTNAISASQVDFWKVDGSVGPNSSWMNAPRRSSLFGSALMQNGTTSIVVNSSKCREIRSLRACVANRKRGEIVVFNQLLSEGLILSYDC